MAARCSRLMSYVFVSLGVPFAFVKLQALNRCVIIGAHQEVRWNLGAISTCSLAFCKLWYIVAVNERPTVNLSCRDPGGP